MKKFLTFVAVLLFAYNVNAQTSLTEAVNFTSTAHHGEEIDLFEILDGGQYVVLDFFFTTCHFCNEGLPYVIDAYYEFGENQDSVYFMEISPTDHNRAPFYFVDKYIDKYSVPFPTIHTETGGVTGDEIFEMYDIEACPTFVFISPDRKILLQDYSVYNAPSADVLIKDLRKLMNKENVESLDVPTNLTSETVNYSSIKLSWNEVENAYRYDIYCDGELIEEDVSGTSFTVTGLQPDTEYCFSVAATLLEIESEKSEESCAKTDDITLFPPTNIVATVTDKSVTLTWDAAEDATAYNIYRGTTLLASVTETTYTEESLEPETQYCYMLTTAVGTIESLPTEEICATTDKAAPTVPAAPVVTATAIDGAVNLIWEAVEGATYYTLYYGGNKLQSFEDTEVNVAVPQPGQYCFTVTASNDMGESEPSNEACATVVANPDVEAPFAPELTVTLEDGYAVLTWTPVETATFYSIYYKGNKLGDVVATTQAIELQESGEYCFTVTASNMSGESVQSNEACVVYGDAIEENVATFNIYPNPVNDKLFIATEMEVVEVSVYDVYGRQLTTDYGQQTINVAELSGGIYFVKVRTESGEIVKRFVKK